MKFNLKTAIMLVAFSVSATITKSQTINSVNSGYGGMSSDGGAPIAFKEYSDLVGTPFFNSDWVKGDVTFADGSAVQNKLVKYDEIKDLLYTQTQIDKTGLFDQPVVAFTIITKDGTLARFSKFSGNDKFTNSTFFQVLSDGKVKLLKKNAKSISEY